MSNGSAELEREMTGYCVTSQDGERGLLYGAPPASWNAMWDVENGRLTA